MRASLVLHLFGLIWLTSRSSAPPPPKSLQSLTDELDDTEHVMEQFDQLFNRSPSSTSSVGGAKKQPQLAPFVAQHDQSENEGVYHGTTPYSFGVSSARQLLYLPASGWPSHVELWSSTFPATSSSQLSKLPVKRKPESPAGLERPAQRDLFMPPQVFKMADLRGSAEMQPLVVDWKAINSPRFDTRPHEITSEVVEDFQNRAKSLWKQGVKKLKKVQYPSLQTYYLSHHVSSAWISGSKPKAVYVWTLQPARQGVKDQDQDALIFHGSWPMSEVQWDRLTPGIRRSFLADYYLVTAYKPRFHHDPFQESLPGETLEPKRRRTPRVA